MMSGGDCEAWFCFGALGGDRKRNRFFLLFVDGGMGAGGGYDGDVLGDVRDAKGGREKR